MSSDIARAFMLFEPGAPAAAGTIPLCVPEIRGNEWKYVKECLDTNFVSSVGPFVDRFETALADRVGVRHAVATTSGTAALHIALLVSGVQPDDEVLVSTLTFIAPANAIRYVGAWPVFIDAEPDYWQIDPARVVEFVERHCRWQEGELRNQSTGRRVAAILPVHILGHPVDMDPILEIARTYGLPVIEDATESLGAAYKGRAVGSLGDIACFSFNGNKIITSGGGGMIVTHNEAWTRRAKYLTTQAKDDSIEYVHETIGYNYRLTNIQAAVGLAQLEHLDEYVTHKRRIATTYAEALLPIRGITAMVEAEWASSSSWLFTVLVDAAQFGRDSRALGRALAGRGIQTRPLWQPVHLSPAHRGTQGPACTVAERLNRDAISLPSSVGLSASDQAAVVAAVASAGYDPPARQSE